MANRRIDYDKIPEEFKHLDKKDQSKLFYQSEAIAKKLKKLPPELMHSLTQKMADLGENQSSVDDFIKLFDEMVREAELAIERDRKDRKKYEKKVDKASRSKCRCDFLPDSPLYKNKVCDEKDCCRK